MKGRLKTTMINNSTSIIKMKNCPSPQIIENKKKTYQLTFEIQVLAWYIHNVAGLNQLMVFQLPPPLPLDNWISNGNTDVNKPVCKGNPENMVCVSSSTLYTGLNYMHYIYSLMSKMRLAFKAGLTVQCIYIYK